jgi:hypothetical protein
MGKTKLIIIIAVIAIIGFVVYAVFIKADPEIDSILSESSTKKDKVEVLGKDILRAINQIQTLNLDKSIFQDPVLNSLIDNSQEISPLPVGRDNPFEPIGGRPAVNQPPRVEAVNN